MRYADDFVVFCKSKEEAQKAKSVLSEWLTDRGLQLSDEKTKIVQLSGGFDFLGFNVRLYKVKGTKTGWKLLIKPSNKSVQKLRQKLRTHWLKLNGSDIQAVLSTINPIIRGWANYFRKGVASATFKKLDKWMFMRQTRYVNRTHSRKPKYWKTKKYWGRLNLERQDQWVFGDKKTGSYLLKFRWFKVERHVLVKGRNSPDDPKLKEYWKKRWLEKSKDRSPRIQKIAQKQKGVCLVCKESLFNDEPLHLHHKIPKSKGGRNTWSNLQIIHLYCHQQVHKQYTPEQLKILNGE